jgi:hypothetical protein
MTDEREVASALADLAATAGVEPLALPGIETRARRLRRQRRAGRAVVVVASGTALSAGLVVALSHGPGPTRVSAAGPPPAVLPLCTSLDGQAGAPPPGGGRAAASVAGTGTTTGGQAAAKSGPTPTVPMVGEQFKAPGTVAAAPAGGSVTILVASPLHDTPQPVAFTITGQTQVFTDGQPAAIAALQPGHAVGLVATRTGPASFQLDQVETDPGRQPAARSYHGVGAPAPAAGGAVQGKGSIVAVSGHTVRLSILGGSLGGRTLDVAVTPATRFVSIGNAQQCDPTGLPAGTGVGFTATATGTGTYRLDELDVA